MKEQEKRRQIPLRLPEHTFQTVQQDAAARNLSINSYIEYVLSETARSEEQKPDESACWIRVDPGIEAVLKKKARHAGVSLQEYLHTCANPTPPVVLQVKIHDLDKLSDTVTGLIETVNASARVLLRKETASPVEVDRMIRQLREIHEAFKEEYRSELEDRERLYHEAKRELTGMVKNVLSARKSGSGRSSEESPGDDHAGSPG